MASAAIWWAVFGIALFHIASGLNVSFHPSKVEKIYVDQTLNVTVIFNGVAEDVQKIYNSNWTAKAEPTFVLGARLYRSFTCDRDLENTCNCSMELEGRFLGFGTVHILRQYTSTRSWEKLYPPLQVTVLREDKLINKIFIAFVAVIVSINYINMGCALDMTVVKEVIKRPIGPAVGFVCQFVVMPLVSYGVGYLLFEDPVLRLGLFTFGSSPGGGASNMWTVLLGGNLNLSITMTFISTIAALGTLPLWLFTLGKTILKETNIVIPYTNILTSLASLTIPVALGLLIQHHFPKVAAKSKRYLAPICIILLLCIIVLACVANFYMFYMLTLRMVIAASLSVWAGFLVGVLVSLIFRFPAEDTIAVAVETGVQNSGIAFVLLSYSLKPPASEMASVVPVAGSIITPIPLFMMYCYQRIRNCYFRSDKLELQPINSKKENDKCSMTGMENLGQSDVNY